MKKTPEELNEQWQDIGMRLTMYVVGEFERQAQFIYNKFKNNGLFSKNEKDMYLTFLLQNKDNPQLKSMVYEYMRINERSYDKALEILNGHTPIDRIEILEWVIENCLHESEELSKGDETFKKAIINRINSIKMEHHLI